MEEAAHALPTTCSGKLIGTLASDVTVFSFYANKTMTTGEGGMLVTRNPELARRARVMRLHGISRDAFDRFTAKAPSWYYEVVAPGFKYNLTDITTAIGIEQLKKCVNFQGDVPKSLRGTTQRWLIYPLSALRGQLRVTNTRGIYMWCN